MEEIREDWRGLADKNLIDFEAAPISLLGQAPLHLRSIRPEDEAQAAVTCAAKADIAKFTGDFFEQGVEFEFGPGSACFDILILR